MSCVPGTGKPQTLLIASKMYLKLVDLFVMSIKIDFGPYVPILSKIDSMAAALSSAVILWFSGPSK